MRLSAFDLATRAIAQGDVSLLARIVGDNPDTLNVRNEHGLSLIDLAALEDHEDAVRALVVGGTPPDVIQGAVYSAACGGRLKALQALIDSGVPMDMIDPENAHSMTAVECAVMHGCRESAAYLVDRIGVARPSLWAAAGCGEIELVKSFFGPDGRLKPEAGRYRIHPSAIGTADLKPLSGDPQEILDEALCYACGTGQIEVADYLLSMGADPNGEPYYSKPLHFAVWNDSARADRLANKRDMVDFLLAHGADVNGRDGRGFGAWRHWAKDEAIKDYLIDVNPRLTLHDAVEAGRADRVAALLDAEPDLLDRQDRVWPEDEVGFLNCTALHMAVYSERSEMVRLLLARGASADVQAENGMTALEIARARGLQEIIDLLRKG